MKVLYWIFLIILFVGWVNWALYAWLDFNAVSWLFADVTSTVMVEGVETTTTAMNLYAKIVYSLVGFSALWTLVTHLGCKKCCK